MKIAELKILFAIALLFLTASAQALQPEVLYAFQQGPEGPAASLVQGSDGNFYGTSYWGGSSGAGAGSSGGGTVFKMATNGVLITLVSFNGTNGAGPQTALVLGNDGAFYGTTAYGGSGGAGTLFRVTTNGMLTSLVSFNGTNGAGPNELVLGNDGYFYGTTSGGGSNNNGTVFKMTTNGVLITLVSFNGTNGANPQTALVLGSDGHFYGTAYGGSSGHGTVFKVSTNGVLTTLVSFNNTNGAGPNELVLGSDGAFYGTTGYGGSGATGPWTGSGTVFKVTTNGVLTSLVSFSGTNGANPHAGLVLGSDGAYYGTTEFGGSGGSGWGGTVFKVTTNGLLTTLVSFNGTNGERPQGALLLGNDGHFYGTTSGGGSSYGTVFKMTLDGVLTTLDGREGVNPNELVLGNDGHFYGITVGGGRGNGTVFRVATSGALTTLVSCYSARGIRPQAPLALASDGKFYGTTDSWSGRNPSPGTVFQVTTNGVLTTLVSFSFDYPNGAIPHAGLVLGRDGNFYGTTSSGGTNNIGTVFQVTTNGVLTTLVSFDGTNGANPHAELALDDDGNFYGTTSDGGSSGKGTVFKMTTNGVLTSLISFSGTNGANPAARMVLGSDGYFYGTTYWGGTSGLGTAFKMTTSGLLTSLVSFSGPNGAYPQARLLLSSDGNFYGTSSQGGSSYLDPDNAGYGTVFRVTTNGVLTSLVSFAGTNGANPQAGLVLGRDGHFYGTTTSGGPGGGGTIFRLVISAFASVARQPGGSVLLTGTGPANGGYRLWASTDLSLPLASWTLLTSASFDSNGDFSYTDAGAATNPSRFYQLSVP